MPKNILIRIPRIFLVDILYCMIPPAKQSAVKNALRSAFDVEGYDEIQPLTKGLSGAGVFKIIVRAVPYVLRVITRVDETRDKPAYYFECLQMAANAGIAPRIHYLNIEDGISIIEYIEGQFFPQAEARIKMADLLRKLHSLPKFAHQMKYIDASDAFLQRFQASKIVPEHLTKNLFESYARIVKVYPRHDPGNLVSCHNDVKADNILFDGLNPWLVDWEAARLNDRYLDLAAIANFVVKSEKDEMELLNRYFGESLDEYKRARFFLMSQITHMFCFTLCTIAASSGKSIDINKNVPGFNEFHDRLWNCEISLANNEEKLEYALVHMNEFRIKMQTKRFEESLRIVAAQDKFRLEKTASS